VVFNRGEGAKALAFPRNASRKKKILKIWFMVEG
jgi:hypothetical protein